MRILFVLLLSSMQVACASYETFLSSRPTVSGKNIQDGSKNTTLLPSVQVTSNTGTPASTIHDPGYSKIETSQVIVIPEGVTSKTVSTQVVTSRVKDSNFERQNKRLTIDLSDLDVPEIKLIQERLQTLGYKPGVVDGFPGSRTNAAIFEYIHCNVNADPNLILRMIKAELGNHKSECDISIMSSRKVSVISSRKTTRATTFQQLSSVKDGQRIFLIDKVDCISDGSMWILLFEGEVTESSPRIMIELKERYGLRITPDSHGISTSDWYCVPKRLYCYSKVKFDAWSGTNRKGDILPVDINKSFKADKYQIPIGAHLIGNNLCKK